MRQSKIEYMPGLPIKFSLMSIENAPLHWQNTITIVLVLAGSMDIEIGLDGYHIKQGELEIVNPNEIHGMRSTGEKNKVLLLYIDPDFFAKYYKDAKDVFYYADSSTPKTQQAPRYQKLKQFIAVLFYESMARHENYKDAMEEQLLAMMFYLLNNFHYLFYEEESLREDESELKRYHRIVQHINNNYMEKVTLKKLAEQELLTAQYLSFKIKDTFGYSFNDFLNSTRVEESLKLLLSTDKNISEISEEIGFSHVRYYNKNFKDQYQMTPMQYRKKYQVSNKLLQQQTKVTPLPLEEALPYVEKQLYRYDRFQYDDRIRLFDIDVEGGPLRRLKTFDTIQLGSSLQILQLLANQTTKEDIRALGFGNGLVTDLAGIAALSGEDVQIHGHALDTLLDTLRSLSLAPVFLLDEWPGAELAIKDYVASFRKDMQPEDIQFMHAKEYAQHVLIADRVAANDGLEHAAQVFAAAKNGHIYIPRLADRPTSNATSDTFFGGDGLLTHNGLKKPAYYMHLFLTQMGAKLLYAEEGMLVTASDNGFEILLASEPSHKSQSTTQKKRYSLNIIHTQQNYQVIRCLLHKDSGSVYDKWEYMGRPPVLGKENIKLLEIASQPEIRLYTSGIQMVHNIFTTLDTHGAELYLFQKLPKSTFV